MLSDTPIIHTPTQVVTVHDISSSDSISPWKHLLSGLNDTSIQDHSDSLDRSSLSTYSTEELMMAVKRQEMSCDALLHEVQNRLDCMLHVMTIKD